HAGDPDLYVVIKPSRDGNGRVTLTPVGKIGPLGQAASVKVTVVQWNEPADQTKNIAYKPDGDWKHAVPMTLGETVFGAGDLAPYIPTEVPEATRYYDAAQSSADLTASARTDRAEDWLVFDYARDDPKLVYLQLDLPERDHS